MNHEKNNSTYQDWDKFQGQEIPSSLNTYPILYERTRKEMKIVDIGCGYGKTCFELVLNGYDSIVGFDINQTGIEDASVRLNQLPKDISKNCTFIIDDALHTTFEDAQFDLGIMQAFLTTMTSKDHRIRALQEARRIIAPNGGLYLTVFMQTWHNNIYRKRYEKDAKVTGEEGSFNACDKETDEVLYQARHYTEKELVYLLDEAGFAIDHFKYETFTTRTGNEINGAVIWAS